MIHRMTPTSNKRLILLYSTLVLLPLVGVLSFRLLPTFWAFAVLALCLLLARGLYRLARPYIRSTIESLEDRIIISVPDHPLVEIPFDTIDLSGEFRIQGMPALFLYGKDQDKLYTFPKEYTGFEVLKDLFSKRMRFEALPAQNTEELKKLIRERFG